MSQAFFKLSAAMEIDRGKKAFLSDNEAVWMANLFY